MKKLLAILAAMVMLLGTLAGCTVPASTPQGGDTGKTEEAAPSDTAEADLPTLKCAHLCGSTPRDLALVEEKISEITRKELGCNIELVPVEMGNMYDKMNLLLSGGEDSLDVYPIVMWSTLTGVVKNGQALCLDDYMEEYGAALKDTIIWDYVSAGKVNGKQYGIPLFLGFATTPVFDMDAEIAEKIGVEDGYSTDLDGLTEIFRKIREVDPDTPLIATQNTYNASSNMVTRENVPIDGCGYACLMDYGQSDEVVSYYFSEQFEHLMGLFDIWSHELNAYMPDALSNSESKADYYLANKAYGMFNQNIDAALDANVYTNMGRKSIGINMPGGPLENPVNYFAVSSTTKYPELSLQYIGLMASNSDIENLLINGIEGVNYVLTEEGTTALPEGVASRAESGWSGMSWANMNLTLCYPSEPGYWDYFVAANKAAKPSKAFGFVFDPEPVADEISACDNVCNKYLVPFYVGAVTDYPATIEQFRNELTAAGVDKIVEECKKQFEEWLALQ
ncbi:MAG: ABC transporter substrate-binding protein [Lachnospiraceae bacterium]|nr:ABC transporter substrate-binding protein [Lachnospiraceae bacterium]